MTGPWTLRWYEWPGRLREKTVDYLTPYYEFTLQPRRRDMPRSSQYGYINRLMRIHKLEGRTATLVGCGSWWV